MEIKIKKNLTNVNNGFKEESPKQIQKKKSFYISNTIKNFNKSKDFQKIIEDGNENENESELLNSIKHIYQMDNGKNQKKQMPIRYTINFKGLKSIYDNNIIQKNRFFSNLNRNNNSYINNYSIKNIKKTTKKFPISAIKKDSQKCLLKNFLSFPKNSYSNIKSSNNSSSHNLMNSLNNIVNENKKKIKQNQGKLNNLIKLIKNKETVMRNNEENENFDKAKENRTQQVFRYTKKFPMKSSEINHQNKFDKNEFVKNLKKAQMKKQNTSSSSSISTNNFIINGLNQIYKKSFTSHDEKYNNYILNKDDNKNYKDNENNNRYSNRIFSSTSNIKNSESVSNIRVKISLGEKKNNKDKKDSIYVNRIKQERDNKFNNIKISDINNINNINANYITENQNMNRENNLNMLNYDSLNSNKNTIENKNNILLNNKYIINSPKTIYIPKKATTYRGVSQESVNNIKRQNISPIYKKKPDNSNNNSNNIKNENECNYYFLNSEKRKNNYEENFFDNNGRATYSRKYSGKKQNYCWQNNNSFDDKMKNKDNNDKNDNKNFINKDKEKDELMKEIFENDMDDISSIKINSSYESYTMDYESNINRIKLPIFIDDYNNKTEKKKYSINNGGNIINRVNYVNPNIQNINKKNNDLENNIKIKKYPGVIAGNQNKITASFNNNNNKEKLHKIESKSNEKIELIKQGLKSKNSEKKFAVKLNDPNYEYINSKTNDPNVQNIFYATTSSFPKMQNNYIKDNNINQNELQSKTQRNFFINKKIQNINEQKNIKLNNNNTTKKILKEEILSFELDDLVVIEEKLKNISSSLDGKKPVYLNCFDFWNYFKNNCEILHNLKILIKNEEDLIVIKNGINYILISIIFIFDYSYKKSILNNISLFLKEIINFNYQNLILIYEYLLENTFLSEVKNIWELKLNQIISKVKSDIDNNTSYENLILNVKKNSINNGKDKDNNETNMQKIKNNINFVFQIIRIIIKNYKNKNNNILLSFFKEIQNKSTLKDFFYFFQDNILYSNGLFGYMSPQLVLKQNNNIFNTVNPPYIKSISKKKYSLILSLEETLINFKLGNSSNNGISGILRFRPGVNFFLSEMKKYYELIIFSLYPQKIGDYLIDTLEKKEKYFDYRFFIQHSVIVDNEFVKDLRRIGRSLDKMIIVDNLPQNYKLNKKNGINIISYWEENYNDIILGDLAQILINIAKDGGDVRDGIEKYRKEIIGKVSSRVGL